VKARLCQLNTMTISILDLKLQLIQDNSHGGQVFFSTIRKNRIPPGYVNSFKKAEEPCNPKFLPGVLAGQSSVRKHRAEW